VNLKSLTGVRSLIVAFAAALASLSAAHATHAQEEGVPVVVDEVIAQVNNDVVTLSMLKREMSQALDALKQRGMNDKEAADEVEKNRAKIIANLINERLVIQKGKDIPRLTEDVEAEVNREMLRVAKTQGISSIEQLDEELRKAKYDPVEIRQTLRTQFTRQAVMQREVDSKIYFSITDDELQKYFAAHPDKFRKPEAMELSEIFLSLAGKPEAEVRAKAAQLVAQARAGADFGKLAASYSEREVDGQRVAPKSMGKVGRFELPDLRPELAAALKSVPKGGISEPVRLDEGIQIFRVDERSGSAEPVFNEQHVRGAMTQERSPKEQEDYMKKLRNESYIKVAPAYESLVLPLLPEINSRSTASKDDDSNAAKKTKNKKP
jgi:peptidyl-prolyl cis-trans isomerase SurA